MFSLLMLIACSCFDSSSATQNTVASPVFDPKEASREASSYIKEQKKLYDTGSVFRGPVCLGEPVIDGFTLCTYTLNDEPYELLCNTSGCIPEESKVTLDALDKPDVALPSSSSDEDYNEWLMWYLLLNQGGGTTYVNYHTWYDTTPNVYRSGYYTPFTQPAVVYRPTTTYIPSAATAQKLPSYTRTITTTTSTSPHSATTSTKSTTSKSTSSTTSSTTSKSSSSSASKPSSTTGYKSTTSSKSTRSTGYRSSSSRGGKR